MFNAQLLVTNGSGGSGGSGMTHFYYLPSLRSRDLDPNQMESRWIDENTDSLIRLGHSGVNTSAWWPCVIVLDELMMYT